MTSEEFLLTVLEIEPERFDQEGSICIGETICDYLNLEETRFILKAMTDYARLMCMNQRRQCYDAFNKDLDEMDQRLAILNAPEPKWITENT